MPYANRRQLWLGIQPIALFARRVTLHQVAQCWESFEASEPFPQARGMYNIAALAMFPRGRLLAGGEARAQMLSLSFWSDKQSANVPNIFGQSFIQVPQGAEYFSVSWFAPPAWALEATGPFPEDLFRVQWELQL